ncbi:MAG: hypothetical protein IRY87_02665 [Acetobacteraceae bacterium]|nr:hypothetical protein [Acetobacteraceae bacterium]
MRRLVLASALGLGLLAVAGAGGPAAAMPLGMQAPLAAAAPDASLLEPVHYRRSHYAPRRHYHAPPRHHWRHHHHHHRGWR